MARSERIVVGVITSSHGVSGLVKVTSYTEPLEKICSGQHLLLRLPGQQEKPITLELKHKKTKLLICRIDGISSREQADRLRGGEITIKDHHLDQPEEEEFYQAKLVSKPVVTESGSQVGKVLSLRNFGAGDLVEVQLNEPEERVIYLPFIKTLFTTITDSTITVDKNEFTTWKKAIL